jgi:hypothetical protein
MWPEVGEAPPGADAGAGSPPADGRRSLDTFGSARPVFVAASAH